MANKLVVVMGACWLSHPANCQGGSVIKAAMYNSLAAALSPLSGSFPSEWVSQKHHSSAHKMRRSGVSCWELDIFMHHCWKIFTGSRIIVANG